MDRRSFLFLASTAALRPRAFAQPPSSPPRVSATGPAGAAALQKYAAAVAKLKALPSSDPRNWINQANIHNGFCPHRNWWFLPWHRAYLFFFEQICQQVLADPTFRLPYWNWSSSNTIPRPFLDRASSLFDPSRAQTTIPAEIVDQRIVTRIVSSNSLADLFSGATTSDQQRQSASQGLLESGPHNGVHATILGDMGNFTSPLDPIFWLHHCNIDRIWASWSRNSAHLPPSASLWNNHALARFFDPASRQQVTPPASAMPSGKWLLPYDALESPVTRPVLPHTIQNLSLSLHAPASRAPVPTPHVRRRSGQSASVPAIALGSGANIPVAVPADLEAPTSRSAPRATPPGAAPLAATPANSAFLVIQDVPFPSRPSTALRLFLNNRQPSPDTSLSDPSYLGTFSFFGANHDAAMPGMANSTFSINITDALQAALQAVAPGTPLQVGIVPIDLANPRRASRDELVRPARIQVVTLGTQP